jgi:hypothetical protein
MPELPTSGKVFVHPDGGTLFIRDKTITAGNIGEGWLEIDILPGESPHDIYTKHKFRELP